MFLFPPSPAKAQVMDGLFWFEPSTATFIQGCDTTINIMEDTGSNKSNAANVYIKYNPSEVEILDGNPHLPGKQIIPGQRLIEIGEGRTGFQLKEMLEYRGIINSDQINLALFQPISNIDNEKLKFFFIGFPYGV